MLLLPTWSLVHSRMWKMQIPYLARHFRVVTFDRARQRPLGPAGRRARVRVPPSSWPTPRRARRDRDRAGGGRGRLVRGGVGDRPGRRPPRPRRARCLHRTHRGPGTRAPRGRQVYAFETEYDHDEGWAKLQRPRLEARLPRLRRVLLQPGRSPSRTRPSRSRTRSAGRLETDPETLARHAPGVGAGAATSRLRRLCARVRCPVLVIHGDDDAHPTACRTAPPSREATGGSLVTLEGSGHLPHRARPGAR